jgi:hypothetical protein
MFYAVCKNVDVIFFAVSAALTIIRHYSLQAWHFNRPGCERFFYPAKYYFMDVSKHYPAM